MNPNPDAIIIGAGVVGCSIALALSRRGLSTLNLDSLPAAGYGSTSHSSAIIRPIYSHVTSCALAHECRSIWQEWERFLATGDERGFARYTECGGLVLMKAGEEDRYENNLKAMDEVGVEYRILSVSELEVMYPGISLASYGPPKPFTDESFGLPTTGSLSGGIHVRAAGYVSDPQLATHNLQCAAENLGAGFRFNSQVAKILQERGKIAGVELVGGDVFSSPIVINAAGPHSAAVNALAGVRTSITTRPLRHEVAFVPANARHFRNDPGFLIDMDTGVYQRPDGADLLIGSADPECDPEDVVDPDHYNTEFTGQWTLQVHRAAQRFPELGIPGTARGTVGVYDVSDDWIPLYDKTDLPGFYLAVGTSGNQFKNAPLIGEILAEIIAVDRAGGDHDRNPARLHLKKIDRVIRLDFYSRHRPVQETRSVMA